MKNNLINRSFQAAIWNYIGGISKALAQLIIQVWLARILGPEVFGQYATVLIVISLGWLFSDAGFGSALIQKAKISDEDIGYALGWILLVSTIVGVTTSLSSPWIANYMGDASLKWPLMVCGPIIGLQALANLSASLLRRDLNMKRLQIIQVSAYLVGFGLVAMPLAYLNYGVWSLVLGFLIQTLITLIFGYLSVRHTLKPKLSGDVNLRNFGGNVLGVNMANWAIENLDRFIIGKQWGIQALGAYSAAFNLSRSPSQLLVSTLQSVVFSSASRVQDDLSRVRRGYLAVLSLSALLSFPFFALLALKAEFVINLLYGEKWHAAIPLFEAFCIVIPFYVILAVTGPVLSAIGMVKSEFKIQICIMLALVIGLLLLSDLPLNKVVWFIPILYFARFLLMYIAVATRLSLAYKETIAALIGAILVTLIMVFVVLISSRLISAEFASLPWFHFLQLFMSVLVGWGVLHIFPGKLIGKDLSQLLLMRATDNKPARILCRLLALKGAKV
jgi:O-antigen/teichoic acid export membrane protein